MSEAFLTALLILNLTCVFTIIAMMGKMNARLARLEVKVDHIERQFQSLAHDFKEHLKQIEH